MKNYQDISDIENVPKLVEEARALKENPRANRQLGKDRTLGMVFFNASLRTRLSTEKAARNLGMEVMVLNVNSDAWGLEFGNGTVMDGTNAEHIKEAAAVISQYVDIIAVRAFAGLEDRKKDEAEQVLNGFLKYATVPIINMESAIAHPLQALADAITITENKIIKRPKVVLSWAPHPKALPHAVANSFIQMMRRMDVDFSITHPEGYDLNPNITGDTAICHNQYEALKDADFVYVKNWSSYESYGKVLSNDPAWMMTQEKLGKAKFMHCLPVRRNVVVEDAVLDGGSSLVLAQASNRTYAAQAVIKGILENSFRQNG